MLSRGLGNLRIVLKSPHLATGVEAFDKEDMGDKLFDFFGRVLRKDTTFRKLLHALCRFTCFEFIPNPYVELSLCTNDTRCIHNTTHDVSLKANDIVVCTFTE